MTNETVSHHGHNDLPNEELVRRAGWRVNAMVGPYCVAWRGRDEVVLVWREGEWQALSGPYRDAG